MPPRSGQTPHLERVPAQPGQPAAARSPPMAAAGWQLCTAGAVECARLRILRTQGRHARLRWPAAWHAAAGCTAGVEQARRVHAGDALGAWTSAPQAAPRRLACKAACFVAAVAACRCLRRRTCTPSASRAAAHTAASGAATAATGKELPPPPGGTRSSQTEAL